MLDLLMNHRSIRQFTDQKVERAQLEAIIRAAQSASTSSNMQAYSVIHAASPELKQQLAVLAGNQAYVEKCGAFLVWCADLQRLEQVCLSRQRTLARTTENMIIATVDAALAAQNAAIAAESMGMGIVYIGGIRNQVEEVAKLLKLPELVCPLFGMCIGYPDQQPDKRPRLPLEGVLHTDQYDAGRQSEAVQTYDQAYRDYMLARSGGRRDTIWSDEMAERASRKLRLHMREFLEKQGFAQE